jgi:signal transduction histidine kinase
MTTSLKQEPVRLPELGGPIANLQDVDIVAELRTRPRRAPDNKAADLAMAVLAREMAENPRNMLQTLVEVAVDLCRAGTAGISLLDGDVFRWEAVAGVFASYRNGTMPRAASPCGVCIDRDLPQLMHLADRCFPALRTEPRFVEALLIPFHHHGKAVGTVWVVAHDNERKFDGEDERIMSTLAQFASAGWQLWRAYAAADESSRRKDEYLAMLGHELRNPLAAIVSATSLLRQVGTVEKPLQTRALDILARQGQHLSRIVDDLLDVSRLTQDKLELKKALIDLAALVANAIDITRPQISRRRHRLSVSLPPRPVWLHADPVRMAQLLANLLDNAAKFTPDGGEIWLTASATDLEIAITVRDSGRGIAEEHLRTVFDLFAQPGVHSGDGLGLGLTLVRRLTEMHGGRVEAASDGPGKGSQFTVRLPVAPSSDAVPESAEPRAVDAPQPRRILVVDDNEDVAEGLASSLVLDGHTVKTTHDGPSALAAVTTFAPDIVLLDVGLPGMDGYEVARRMREAGENLALVIIAITGYGQSEDRLLSQLAGCNVHLVKPVAPDVLRAALELRVVH